MCNLKKHLCNVSCTHQKLSHVWAPGTLKAFFPWSHTCHVKGSIDLSSVPRTELGCVGQLYPVIVNAIFAQIPTTHWDTYSTCSIWRTTVYSSQFNGFDAFETAVIQQVHLPFSMRASAAVQLYDRWYNLSPQRVCSRTLWCHNRPMTRSFWLRLQRSTSRAVLRRYLWSVLFAHCETNTCQFVKHEGAIGPFGS